MPAVELDATVDAWAARLAAGPTRLLGAIKEAVYRGRDLSFEEATALEAAAIASVRGSAEQREGLAAFLEKHPARFAWH